MKIKIKSLSMHATIPTRGTEQAAAFDLYSATDFPSLQIRQGETVRIKTGLAVEIPAGFCGVVYSRSSTALKGLIVTPLLVDADYRGEVFVTVHNASGELYTVQRGDRIAQLRIERLEPTEFVWANGLSETRRGSGGYGSTGR